MEENPQQDLDQTDIDFMGVAAWDWQAKKKPSREGFQYSLASPIVSTRVVCAGSAGSSDPDSMLLS